MRDDKKRRISTALAAWSRPLEVQHDLDPLAALHQLVRSRILRHQCTVACPQRIQMIGLLQAIRIRHSQTQELVVFLTLVDYGNSECRFVLHRPRGVLSESVQGTQMNVLLPALCGAAVLRMRKPPVGTTRLRGFTSERKKSQRTSTIITHSDHCHHIPDSREPCSWAVDMGYGFSDGGGFNLQPYAAPKQSGSNWNEPAAELVNVPRWIRAGPPHRRI